MADDLDLFGDPPWVEMPHDHHWSLLRLMTGREPDSPYGYPRNALGLTMYLRQCGIDHFCGAELSRVGRPDVLGDLARQLPEDATTGLPALLPARVAWPRAACILLIAERMRAICGPLSPHYWWRPSSYNAAISAANEKPKSDHISASAIDLSCQHADRLDAAVEAVIDPIWLADCHAMVYGISIGHRRGSHKIHLGVWAPATAAKGKPRRWSYDPRTGAEVPYR